MGAEPDEAGTHEEECVHRRKHSSIDYTVERGLTSTTLGHVLGLHR